MDGIFTIPYAEYCVAEKLSEKFPTNQGYSVFAPLSRQERGVDLALVHRTRSGSKVATVQVKGSRTYSRPKASSRAKRPFRYYTWFNTFNCPKEADFFCFVALYPAVDAAQKRELGTWWSPQVLLFSQLEMRRFLRSVRTKAGSPDKMFGFGFDTPDKVFQSRGDRKGRFREFTDHLLARRSALLREFLA
jgi:hypothetical protein